MEYMRIDSFLGSAASKLLNKGLTRSLGFSPNISLDNVIFQTDENDLVRLDLTATMSRQDFERMIEEVTK